MKFEFKQATTAQNIIKISGQKLVFNKKIDYANLDGIQIDSKIFQNKLYGSNKKESQKLQKSNCKEVLILYRKLKRTISLLKRKKCKNFNKIYIKNLHNKTNNNDFLLECMLNLHYSVLPIRRLSRAYYYAGEYLDKENNSNHMCDFIENQCSNHRACGNKKTTGCCPSFCKYTSARACPHKNLSCKIFMCDYLVKKGYYFSPNSIPILKLHLTFPERCACFSLICRKGKSAFRLIWSIRIAGIILSFIAAAAILALCV